MAYYVTIKNHEGKDIEIEVNFEIYKLFDDERKAKERERNEYRRHGNFKEVHDYLMVDKIISVEENYILKEKLCGVGSILKTCTPTQRRRFYLNRIYGYTYSQIARMSECGKSRVKLSVDTVMQKIKEKLVE